MSIQRYKSDAVYVEAVRKFYTFSFVATMFLHIPLGIAGVAMDAPPIPMMMTMAVTQLTAWLIVANTMCATFQDMAERADSPYPTGHTREKTTEMKGNSDIVEVKRTTKYE